MNTDHLQRIYDRMIINFHTNKSNMSIVELTKHSRMINYLHARITGSEKI